MTKIIDQAKLKETKVKKAKKKKATDIVDENEESGSDPPAKMMKSGATDSELEATKIDSNHDSDDGNVEDRFPCQLPVKKTKKRNKNTVQKPIVQNQMEPKPDDRIKLALNYLKTWYKHREQWKFHKGRQACLLNFMYDDTKISDKHFDRLLEYMSGMAGMARDRTIKEAGEILLKKIEVVEDDDEQEKLETDETKEKNSEEDEKMKTIKKQAERAKRILQKLS